jgi:hypothetical protein
MDFKRLSLRIQSTPCVPPSVCFCDVNNTPIIKNAVASKYPRLNRELLHFTSPYAK